MRLLGKSGSSILMVAYPLAMWLGISTLGIRVVGGAVLSVVAVSLARDLRRPRQSRRNSDVLGRLALMAVAGLGILLEEDRLLRLMPVLINATLLVVFAKSLFGRGASAVERLARASGEEVTERRAAYYRRVTATWCLFFVGNGLVILWLALFGSLALWGIYTGVIAYLLMATLFAGEYLVRRLRVG